MFVDVLNEGVIEFFVGKVNVIGDDFYGKDVVVFFLLYGFEG